MSPDSFSLSSLREMLHRLGVVEGFVDYDGNGGDNFNHVRKIRDLYSTDI